MSETAEREIEIVAGVIEGVTQKKPDTWQVAVKPDGSQYTKNLWTKSAELVQALTAKLGQHGAFVCSASYWTNQSGAQVRSLWINSEQDVTEEFHAGVTNPQSDGMSKEEWARKDSAAHKRACIAIAVSALQHTMPSDPSPDDLSKFLGRVVTLSTAWHNSVLAERDDPNDDQIPF